MDGAYCGPAPAAGAWLAAWNFDPLLLAALAAGMWLLRRRGGAASWWGLGVLAFAFVSPLCALSAGLFAMRSLHHLLLVLVAAPLLAAALPARRAPLAPALLVHILLFWAWHVPALYDWALSSHAAYWAMQAALIGSAWWLWSALLRPALPTPALLLGIVAMVAQMGLLGALITFAPAALYAPHYATAPLYGLTPLEDQQLAGLAMWVGSLPLGIAAAWPALARRLRGWGGEAAA